MPSSSSPNSALSELYGISCRSCGAARDLTDAACENCGAPAPDHQQRRNLLQHQDQTRRLLQKVRALKVAGLIARRQRHQLTLQKRVGLTFLLLTLLASLWTIVSIGALERSVGPGQLLVAAMVLATVVYLARQASLMLFSRVAAQAREDVDAQLNALETTVDAVCASCGGHVLVLPATDESSFPCPWCSAALAPCGVASDMQGRHLRTLASTERSLIRASRRKPSSKGERDVEAMRKEIEERRESRRRQQEEDPLPRGFERVGECLLGEHRKMRVWCTSDRVGKVTIHRLEMASRGDRNRALFVWHEVDAVIRAAAAAWHLPLPSRHQATLGHEWLLYAEREVSREQQLLVAPIVHDLQKGDALVVDAAGLSLWRTSQTTPKQLLSECERLAGLIKELREGGAP